MRDGVLEAWALPGGTDHEEPKAMVGAVVVVSVAVGWVTSVMAVVTTASVSQSSSAMMVVSHRQGEGRGATRRGAARVGAPGDAQPIISQSLSSNF